MNMLAKCEHCRDFVVLRCSSFINHDQANFSLLDLKTLVFHHDLTFSKQGLDGSGFIYSATRGRRQC